MLDKPFTNPFGAPIVELPSIDSTNNYALTAIRQGRAKHGAAFFAREQTAGKGQMGRKWVSEKGSAIALSIVLNPSPLPVSAQFHLSACAALAAQEFFAAYAGQETKIKWPNDLYWRDKKAGGILIESIIGNATGRNNETAGHQLWKWAVIGTGININQTGFHPDLPNPVSLKQITGKDYDTLELAKALYALTGNYFTQLLREGFDSIHQQYNNSLYKLNEQVKMKKGSRSFETIIKAVSPMGQLITQRNGLEESFEFGELQWIV